MRAATCREWPPTADLLDQHRPDVAVGGDTVMPCALGGDDGTKHRWWREVPFISCVMACRNQAANLDRLLPSLAAALGRCTHAWQIVLVDIGSTDETAQVVATWLRQPEFRLLKLSRNVGRAAALIAGLRVCTGDVVVTMDADMHECPALMPTFVDHWLDGAEVACGVRAGRRDKGSLGPLGTHRIHALPNIAGWFEEPAGASEFRLMDRSVVDAILSRREHKWFTAVTVLTSVRR